MCNQWVNKVHGYDLTAVVQWSKNYLHKYQSANDFSVEQNLSPTVGKVCWQPPLEGFFKVNTDAALDEDRNVVGVGIVVRSSLWGLSMFQVMQMLSLAKQALSIIEDRFWLESFPPCLGCYAKLIVTF
ncbi:hypothetical protein Dsin_028180 [Dipteronia sinensis]|uniref:RNase H type-1 domain-containing protein n=1 Tax=Dipteronia sinensis TaxID=43782 RepID=A0AAE0DUB4_9ROSI|nr:hypothetical protein Dsin_028180 [Dipteronia sinensis]